ncbi:MAG: sigma-54-dependent Fis family transcriptional regulator, partial [Acidobacteria bacterium]|nr:sigma-54-dependent Fis family transcriptional regulator [Acidobacteriota bacterium]
MPKAAERIELGRVLVVEDDDAYRQFLVAELRDFGFPVEGAGDGQSAVAAIESTSPAVVLLDIRLPGLSGIDVLRRLASSADGGPQVVMLTGHGTIDTAIEAMKLGAYDYLTKPCDLSEMRAVIERALERRELQRENAALRTILRRKEGEVELIGRSRTMNDLEQRIAR